MDILSKISTKLQEGEAEEVQTLVQQAMDEGMTADQILKDGMMVGMDIVSDKFQKGDLFVPEVLIAAVAMRDGMEILRPVLVKSGVKPVGKCVIGTVAGDLHDIGKSLVKMIMESKGIEVIDLGTDVLPKVFVEKALEYSAEIIAISAMLTTTMTVMKDVIALTEEKGIRDKVKVMIGGAPVDNTYAEQIGADCYSADATAAAAEALKLLA